MGVMLGVVESTDEPAPEPGPGSGHKLKAEVVDDRRDRHKGEVEN